MPETSQTATLNLCGFDGPRREEAMTWSSCFIKVTGNVVVEDLGHSLTTHNNTLMIPTSGSRQTPMSKELFVADSVQRGFDPVWAAATFRGVDIDDSGFLGLDEYILGRAALEYDHTHDNGAPLDNLRLRVAFFFYDTNNDGVLNPAKLSQLIRDLCSGTHHVERILTVLYPPLDGSSVSIVPALTLEDFKVTQGSALLFRLP
jgi:hypothetical protein